MTCRTLMALTATALLGGTTLTTTAAAQDAPLPDNALVNPPDRLDVSFPGGNVADFTDEIRRRIPDANIVLMPPVESFELPAISLRGVTLEAAFAVLEQSRTSSEGVLQRFFVTPVGYDANGLPILTVSGERTKANATQRNARGVRTQMDDQLQITSGVFSLAHIVNSNVIGKDEALASIELTLAVFTDEGASTEMRYHEKTGLLVARGPLEQLRAVEDAIDELGAAASIMKSMQDRQANAPTRAEFDGMQSTVNAYTTELDSAKTQVRNLELALDSARRQAAESMQEAQQARDEARNYLRELEVTRIRLEDCLAKLGP
ncbi:MAG: hypothetical protein AAF432_03985 [Planctomycetota bacterium]